ncbi:site-specific integrase [Polynucleobacter paneuropaeus]|nr:site-specific integrase [Polynucleobacter paneuropaeus]
MAKQAKTLNQAELRKVLDYISTRKHSARNRAMLMITFLAGMRVAEVASLKFGDVVDIDGNIRNEIRLTPAMTKGEFARTVFVSERLRKELEQYIRFYNPTDKTMKFFYSQRKESNGFNANTLTQHFHYLYKRVGIVGASSHSGRRSFISNLAARGIGVRVLMGLAGHRAISSTQKYIEINDNMLRSAVELA